MNRTDLFSNRNSSAVLVSGSLWVASVALGGLAVFALRVALMYAVGLLIPQPDQGARLETANVISFVQMCGTVAFGLVFLAVIIYASERFFRDAGKPRMNRTLIRIIVVECIIVLPIWFLFWR